MRPACASILTLSLLVPGLSAAAAEFAAPKFGLKATIPDDWPIAMRERDEKIFVAVIPREDPERPGIVACELALAPENLDAYRTRIDADAKRPGRPGALIRNELVNDGGRERLVSEWEFHPAGDVVWREVKVRLIAHRQLYTFILNVDSGAYERVRARFDAMLAAATFDPPDTGADRAAPAANRWIQREFRFGIDLPEGWSPALAPDEVALLYANGPAHGIWADNVLVIAREHRRVDLEALAHELPDRLRAVEPGCEVLSCKLIQQGKVPTLETVVRTTRGPFSMTVLERRFAGERFDYETKFTVESARFDDLAPAMRASLDSFREEPGDVAVPGVGRAT